MKVKELSKWTAIRMDDRTILASDLDVMSLDQKQAISELDVEETGRKGYYRMMSLSSPLTRYRTAAGLSQAQLAKATGASLRMIQYYEQGIKDIKKANVETVYLLASALNVRIEDLIEAPHL